MTDDGSEPPRFGQLTYTSFDRPGDTSPGGWRVKQVTGDLDQDAQEVLCTGVVTRFESPSSFPRFPTIEEVQNRPRRLMYVLDDDGRGLYWHTVPAGADASGRPGNVFAHCVLDRGCEATDPVRPIEWWRSPEWLVPYGAEEVAASFLPAEVPRPGGYVGREAVVDFLLDPGTWRIGVLSVLLDGVARALDGGSPVVLGCRTPDVAALWIGAVSHFMSPGTSLRFGWSTFDRLYAVDDAVARGAHLVTVPLEDLPGDAPGCVVFDEDESPELGELDGEPHITANGDTVPVTPWSLLAQTVLIDREVALAALTKQDEIAADVGDRGLDAMWPLAMAVVSDSTLHDALDEATAVLLEHTPDEIAATDYARLIVDVVDPLLGDTAEQAADVLMRWRADHTLAPTVRTLAGTVFAHRALDDRQWLAQATPEQLALFEYCPRAEGVLNRADRMLLALHDRAQSGYALRDTAVDALATLDVLARADLLSERGLDVAYEILERAVVPILCDLEGGAVFVEDAGPLDAPALLHHVRTAVVAHADVVVRPLGSRLAREVVAWLTATPSSVPTFEELAADPSLVTTADSILTAEGVFALIGCEGAARVPTDLATVALWRAFFERNGGGWTTPDLTVLAHLSGWSAQQWCRVLELFPQHVAPRFLQNAVVLDRWSTHVDTLARHLEQVQRDGLTGSWAPVVEQDELAGTWAQIRLSDHWTGISGAALDRALDVHVRPVLVDYGRNYPPDVPNDLRSRLAIFSVAYRARIAPEFAHTVPILPPEHDDALVHAVDRDAHYVVDALVDLVKSDALDVYRVVANAVFTSLSAPKVRSVLDRQDLLARFEVGSPPARRALLDEVVSMILADPGYRGPRDTHGVMDAIHTELHRRGNLDVHHACDIYEGFVPRWFEERRLGRDGTSRDQERRRG